MLIVGAWIAGFASGIMTMPMIRYIARTRHVPTREWDGSSGW